MQCKADRIIGWGVVVALLTVYGLTLSPTVSFWDCGEFIATSSGLQVGHPPGAPFYELMAHMAILLSPSADNVALFSNFLSALSAALTGGLLYWTLRLFQGKATTTRRVAAAVGSMCYGLCDTAWFSAVESEVYSLAMLIAAVIVYLSMLYYRCGDRRWLLLLALAAGVGVCTHLLTLLALPAALVVVCMKDLSHLRGFTVWRKIKSVWPQWGRTVALCVLFFFIGLSPYLIVPIRAAANPPINIGNPQKTDAFRSYVMREQYPSRGLYPRLEAAADGKEDYAASWSGGRHDLVGNMVYFVSYQLTYMYLRYFGWNFVGRQNDVPGFGSLQNGQCVTGIGLIDRMLVGTGACLPQSMKSGHEVYFLLPLLLGLIGVYNPRLRERKMKWVVWLLFLMGGPLLSVYLNHPCYEPRERDYAYVVSFYAFAIWIALGVERLATWTAKRHKWIGKTAAVLTLGVPLLMGVQNWTNHDRSKNHVAHAVANNILNSCPKGAMLVTWGDNDTFPLWELQQAEGARRDVEVVNINLVGYTSFLQQMSKAEEQGRAVMATAYAQKALEGWPGRGFQYCGVVYRLGRNDGGINLSAAYDNLMSAQWHVDESSNLDATSRSFVDQHWHEVCETARAMLQAGESKKAQSLMLHGLKQLEPTIVERNDVLAEIINTLRETNMQTELTKWRAYGKSRYDEQMRYYSTMSKPNQQLLTYSLANLNQLGKSILDEKELHP